MLGEASLKSPMPELRCREALSVESLPCTRSPAVEYAARLETALLVVPPFLGFSDCVLFVLSMGLLSDPIPGDRLRMSPSYSGLR